MSNQGLGQVFGRNLRLLCEQRASPSAAARDLGINHVQMHRYLRGEAFPKPAVLKRICDYFGTDARIMTDPLPFDPPLNSMQLRALNRLKHSCHSCARSPMPPMCKI